MIEKEILEGNKLIAKFRKIDTGRVLYPYHIEGEWLEDRDLEYHSSWKWLMPVVEEIESMGYIIEIAGCDYQIRVYGELEAFIFSYGVETDKRTAIWMACCEFIEWYNEQEKK
jgi:hypothetical protein